MAFFEYGARVFGESASGRSSQASHSSTSGPSSGLACRWAFYSGAGANPHRKVPMVRDLGRSDAWREDAVFLERRGSDHIWSASAVRPSANRGDARLRGQFSHAHDSWTLKKLVAIRPPSAWSDVIIAFIGRLWRPFRLNPYWDVRDALGFVASGGGKLVAASPDQIRYLRSVLLEVREGDAFLWLLRWLKNEKHCEPAIYAELTRTASMRQEIEALNAAARYLTQSQKMSRANGRRRAAERKRKARSAETPDAG